MPFGSVFAVPRLRPAERASGLKPTPGVPPPASTPGYARSLRPSYAGRAFHTRRGYGSVKGGRKRETKFCKLKAVFRAFWCLSPPLHEELRPCAGANLSATVKIALIVRFFSTSPPVLPKLGEEAQGPCSLRCPFYRTTENLFLTFFITFDRIIYAGLRVRNIPLLLAENSPTDLRGFWGG